jgi:hypothetical protein
MKLKEYHEFVGTLERYTQEDDCIKLVFVIHTTVELPIGAIPKKELDDCINRKIGIFNNQGDYRLRKFPMPIEHFKNEECSSCEKRDQCSRDSEELFYCLIQKVSELKRKKQESNTVGGDIHVEKNNRK